jgi:hypothetical protein
MNIKTIFTHPLSTDRLLNLINRKNNCIESNDILHLILNKRLSKYPIAVIKVIG